MKFGPFAQKVAESLIKKLELKNAQAHDPSFKA
jgi:hypothetical protein